MLFRGVGGGVVLVAAVFGGWWQRGVGVEVGVVGYATAGIVGRGEFR